MVKGGYRRQVDGTAGLPSTPEMPCASWQLRLVPSPDPREVEACFRTAVAVAREQGTRGYELRAAVSLARLLGEQGRRAETRGVLAPVYSLFTEGFDTPDLIEAMALLEALDT